MTESDELVRELRDFIKLLEPTSYAATLETRAADLIESLQARIAEMEGEREVEWGVIWRNGNITQEQDHQRAVIAKAKYPASVTSLVRRTVGPWKEVTADERD